MSSIYKLVIKFLSRKNITVEDCDRLLIFYGYEYHKMSVKSPPVVILCIEYIGLFLQVCCKIFATTQVARVQERTMGAYTTVGEFGRLSEALSSAN